MKNVMLFIVLIAVSCKSGSQATSKVSEKETVLVYSKGPCLGKCPVYKLQVYSDGMVVYESKGAQRKKVSIISRLSQEEIAELSDLLKNGMIKTTLFKRIRDRPVTVLKYDGKEYEFHASRIAGQLKRVNDKIENLVAQVKVE